MVEYLFVGDQAPANPGAWALCTDAAILYLLEAPGRRAIESGFVSRDNPDETAKNFFLLNIEAGPGVSIA